MRALLVGTAALVVVSGIGVTWGATVASASGWTQQGILTASGSSGLGGSVSLSGDGNTALVGTYNYQPFVEAYVYTRVGSNWVLDQTLSTGDSTAAFDDGAVALSGDGSTALVGDSAKNGNGAVHVFSHTGAGWTEQGTLIAGNAGSGDRFGVSVAVNHDGSVAVVGADGANANHGAAYVFTRTAGSWSQQQELAAGQITANGTFNVYFGASVAVSGDGSTVLVGAHGDYPLSAAYVFARSGASWSLQQELTANPPDYTIFGFSVALSGDGNTALIGDYEGWPTGCCGTGPPGVAYLFTRSGTTWFQQQKLFASDAGYGDHFGTAVTLSADGRTAVIGASYKTVAIPGDLNGGRYAGAAYVFTNTGSLWMQQQELTPSDASGSAYFGTAVAASAVGDTALVGATGAMLSGHAYVFTTASPPPPPPQPADLGVTITSTTHVVSPGATTGPQVTVTVTNNGPGAATGMSLGVQVGGGGFFSSPSAGCTLDATATQLTCTAPTLGAGASSEFSATALMPASKPGGAGQVRKVPEGTPPPSIAVSAAVSSATVDPDLSNNTATLAGGIAIGPSASAAGKPRDPQEVARLDAFFVELHLVNQLGLIAALPPSQRAAAVKKLLESPGVTSLVQADAAALVAQGLLRSQGQGAKQIQTALNKLAKDVVMV